MSGRYDEGRNSGCDPVGCGCMVALVALVAGLLSGRGLFESIISAALTGGSVAVLLIAIGFIIAAAFAVLVGLYMLYQKVRSASAPRSSVTVAPPAPNRPAVLPSPNPQPRSSVHGSPLQLGTWTGQAPIPFDRNNLEGTYKSGDSLLIVRRVSDGSYSVEAIGPDGSRQPGTVMEIWEATKLSNNPDAFTRPQ